MTSPGSGTWSLRFRYLVPAIVCVVVPVVLFALLVPLAQRSDSNAVTQSLPKVTKVGSRQADFKQSVVLDFQLSAPGVVRSNSSGTLTSVSVKPGDSIASGVRLFDVNGAPVFAMPQNPPLYRDLALRMTGADVVAVQQFLVAGGFLPNAPSNLDGSFRSITSKAVCAFQRSSGLPCNGIFSRANVAYVPQNALTVRTVVANVGDRINDGDSILKATAEPVSVDIRPTEENATLADFANDPVVVSSSSGDEVSLKSVKDLGGDSLSVLYQLSLKDGSTPSGTAATPVDATQTTYGGLFLRKKNPSVVATVAGNSVYVAADGAQCVVEVRTGSAQVGPYQTVKLRGVQPAAGQIGQVYTDRAIVGASILRDPEAAPARVLSQCK